MVVAIEFLTDELIKKGIRPSYQRIRVLEYLHQKKGHPTVDEIFLFLSTEIPSLSKATIYNTLHTFVEVGLARTIGIDGDEMRYDITLFNHGHFICDVCGTITNFAINIDDFPINELDKFEIKNKNVYFNGLCPNCLSQQTEERNR